MAGRNEISQLNIPDILSQRTSSADTTTKDASYTAPRLMNHNVDIFRYKLNRSYPIEFGAHVYFTTTLRGDTCVAKLIRKGEMLASIKLSVKAIEEVVDVDKLVELTASELIAEARVGKQLELNHILTR